MNLLLFGARGMLGQELLPVLRAAGHDVTPSDRSSCDISHREPVLHLVKQTKPQFIINCAAYTKVDKAESEPTAALEANALAARNIVLAAKAFDSRLIHISTDYVYGGERPKTPVRETDPEVPCGVYGYSKYLGDEFVRAIHPEMSVVLRTSWLHGQHGPNFVQTIVRLAKDRPELRIVNDQIGSPTWAGWLAKVIAQLIRTWEPGTFHAANRGAISWFEFAQAICREIGSTVSVVPQSSAEVARPAPRPPYSALDCSKLEKLLGEPCQSWEEGLKEHLQQRGK